MLILASDGLYDNLWDEELLAAVAAAVAGLPPPAGSGPSLGGGGGGSSAGLALYQRYQQAAQQLAAALATTASKHAQDTSFRSPWAVELANQQNVSTVCGRSGISWRVLGRSVLPVCGSSEVWG